MKVNIKHSSSNTTVSNCRTWLAQWKKMMIGRLWSWGEASNSRCYCGCNYEAFIVLDRQDWQISTYVVVQERMVLAQFCLRLGLTESLPRYTLVNARHSAPLLMVPCDTVVPSIMTVSLLLPLLSKRKTVPSFAPPLVFFSPANNTSWNLANADTSNKLRDNKKVSVRVLIKWMGKVKRKD